MELTLATSDWTLVLVHVLPIAALSVHHNPRTMKQVRSIVLQQFSNYMRTIVNLMPAPDTRFRLSCFCLNKMFFQPFVILSGSETPRVAGKALHCVAAELCVCVLVPTRTLAFVPGPHDADHRAQTPDRNLPPSLVLLTAQSK